MISKIYIQSMNEIVEFDADNQGLFYSNLKTNNRSVPIIFKVASLQKTLDQVKSKLTKLKRLFYYLNFITSLYCMANFPVPKANK
jgi:hypothetical protein